MARVFLAVAGLGLAGLLPGAHANREPASSYRWLPFETPHRPTPPNVRNPRWVRNPIDAFIAAEHEARHLRPRPEAARPILLRRVYLDLIGLTPTPAEQQAFLTDSSPEAYERVAQRLLDDPRYGERWGRHWMDVWRYSDWAGWTDGNQIRDSKPHIWRWRDWIVASLNADKGYDRMVLEMLAADELAPLDTNALPATGFLVRNYKMLSREQWMDDTVKHTAQAFLGVTVGCAKCHDHMSDPILQADYYRVRAIFEPHHVRTDKLPGQLDTSKDGLVRAYDTATNLTTYLFTRGDERHPNTNTVMRPGVPVALCGSTSLAQTGGNLDIQPIRLPILAAQPDRRDFVIRDTIAAGEKALLEARQALAKLQTNSETTAEKLEEHGLTVAVAEARQASLLATLRAEELEDAKASEPWQQAATEAVMGQRRLAVEEARLKLHQAQVALAAAQKQADKSSATETPKGTAAPQTDDPKPKSKKPAGDKAAKDLEAAQKKGSEAEKALAAAERELAAASTTTYQPRPVESFPANSTGRRLAFARWVTDTNNPLTARVAVNHIWLRHFGRALVPTPNDFGRNGRPPSHPQLLDWLAAEFMAPSVPLAGQAAIAQKPGPWSMKHLHRLIVTSSTYRVASTPDEASASLDPDNVYLWRMNSHRMEAEIVRDNLLYVTGNLDLAMGGPDIDHRQGLTSKRRSLYLRLAAEKEVEFLKIFDGPSVTECYERRPSVVPQQALALANSELALAQARLLAKTLAAEAGTDEDFIRRAYAKVLARKPKPDELRLCGDFLTGKSGDDLAAASSSGRTHARVRENLVLVLFNHNDFVTVR